MKTVLTGGKFNRIHPGHIWLLKKAKKLGYLVIALANDAHNKKPYAVSARVRKRNLEKLRIADKVVIGDKKSFVKVLEKFHPHTIVLGYDQKLPNSETREFVKNYRIKIMKFRKCGKYCTRKM
jgi:FAD synthetase